MITGHQLRHTIINKLQNQIDVYGRGWNPIDYKLNGLKDYRFTIVVENCKRDYWFTEKLLDSFACGTVPIYWGCPSIGDFFDTRGMLIFNDIVELETILQNLTEQVYINMLPHIQHNFDESKKYMLPDAWIHKKIMK